MSVRSRFGLFIIDISHEHRSPQQQQSAVATGPSARLYLCTACKKTVDTTTNTTKKLGPLKESLMVLHISTPEHKAAVAKKEESYRHKTANPSSGNRRNVSGNVPPNATSATGASDSTPNNNTNTSAHSDAAAAAAAVARRAANVARQERLAETIANAKPLRYGRCYALRTHVFCRVCKTSILSTDVEVHEQGRRHIKSLARSGHTDEAQRKARLQQINGRLSGRGAVAEAVRRFGPVITHSPTNISDVHCTLCRVSMNAVSAQQHVEGASHQAAVEAKRAAYAQPFEEAMVRSDKRKAYYYGQFRSKKYEGNRPNEDGFISFARQVKRPTLMSKMPEHYAILYAEAFPTPKQLNDSRKDLCVFARHELSNAVPWHDPLAPNGALLDAGRPLGEVAEAAKKLMEMAVHLQEASGHLELTGYNRKGTDEDPLEFKPIGREKLEKVGGATVAVCHWEVTVPGVSENRPSVLRGDMINIHCDPVQVGAMPYTCKAYVHFVNDDAIIFTLNTAFGEFLNAAKYRCSLAFTQNPSQEKKLVHAVQKIPSAALLLHDTCVNKAYYHINSREGAAPYRAFERLRGELNVEQRAFLDHVQGEHRLSVLWGPPGTGKTTTIVASVIDTLLRAEATGERIRILICTPSNDAADLLSERIVTHWATAGKASLLLRLPGASRDPKSMNAKLLPFCPRVEGGVFGFPDKDVLMRTRVLVTTLMTADRFDAVGIEKKHFTHLFVDEAGHATEQLLAIGLNVAGATKKARNGALRCITKVVLAGDHKQLGPHVTVPTLIEAKLDRSPLLRIYSDELLWEKVGRQLLVCYRSHPAIVRLVNAFYNDELVAHSTSTANPFAAFWRTPFVQRLWVAHCAKMQMPLDTPIVTPSAPILAINHSYPEAKEKDSPSWMNRGEVRYVVEAVETLWDSKSIADFKDLAIITPYRKQVTKIRQELYSLMTSRADLSEKMIWVDPSTGYTLRRPLVPITVGTVDSFQGREARVVIVSCVRSNKAGFNDARFGLGFLSQPERANVALSRAKELLIVIGNKRVLVKDDLWDEYFSRMRELEGDAGGIIMNVAEDVVADDSDDDKGGVGGASDRLIAPLPIDDADGMARMAEEQRGVFRHED